MSAVNAAGNEQRGLRRARKAATLPAVTSPPTPATSSPICSVRRLGKAGFRKSRRFANRPKIKRRGRLPAQSRAVLLGRVKVNQGIENQGDVDEGGEHHVELLEA